MTPPKPKNATVAIGDLRIGAKFLMTPLTPQDDPARPYTKVDAKYISQKDTLGVVQKYEYNPHRRVTPVA